MRVAILFNDDERLEHGEDVDAVAVRAVLEEVEAVESACCELGWEPSRHPFGDRVELGADVVFNLVEGRDEPAAARFLEAAGVPFTGSPGDALELACDKPAARAALTAAGVPIPRGFVLESGDEPIEELRFPAIVKPAREDASHGIDPESIVEDEPEARARARYVLDRYRQPALVEEFAPGPEFGVGLIGAGEVLPMSELRFSGGLRLLTYASKWLPESADYSSATVVPRADDADVAAVARAAWSAIGLRDYGRVDVRLSAAGDPLVIDVNPNPDVSPGAGLAEAAARAGIGYTELIGRIAEGALARGAHLRPLRAKDRPAIAELLAVSGAFSSEEIAVALELIDEGECDDYRFQVAETGGVVAGYACYGPNPSSDGWWDLYWIAVAPDRGRRGLGRALLVAAEDAVAKGGGRTVVVETASKPSYEGARRFYEQNGYDQIARVPGFYAEDDDKLVYCKRLG